MQQLHNLVRSPGASRGRKRVGRGESSGAGKTAGRGGKGQTARTGKGKPRPGFEGGQVPMYRRMPKRGFRPVCAIASAPIGLATLMQHFAAGARVDLAALRARKLVARRAAKLRVLGTGEATHAIELVAHHVTAGAHAKLTAAGATIQLLGDAASGSA